MSLYEDFSAAIPVKILDHNNFKYVAASDVRERLNKILDCKWSFYILTTEVVDDTVIVTASLEIDLGDTKITKQSFGTGEIRRFTKGINKGKPVDVGNAYHTAIADALKSCAKMLGIGNKLDDNVEKDSYDKPPVSTKSSNKSPVKEQKEAKPTAVEERITDEETMSLQDAIAKLKAKKEKKLKKNNSVNSTSSAKPTKSFSKTVVTDEGALNSKLMVLSNFALAKGKTVDDFISEFYGDEVTKDTITDAQVAAILNGSINKAMKKAIKDAQ